MTGAALSIVLLLLLANYGFTGIPVNSLTILSIIAVLFFVYDVICYLFIQKLKMPLNIIATVNLLYCCYTVILMLIHSAKLSTWGFIYFSAEVLLILFLAAAEYKAANRS